jgi:outer membrane protein TolC
MREKAFAEGLSTANDLDDARTRLIGAEIARRVAAYKFVLAWATLHAIAGRMDEFVISASSGANILEN